LSELFPIIKVDKTPKPIDSVLIYIMFSEEKITLPSKKEEAQTISKVDEIEEIYNFNGFLTFLKNFC